MSVFFVPFAFFLFPACLLVLSRFRFFFCPTTAVQVFRAYGLGVQGFSVFRVFSVFWVFRVFRAYV